MPDRKLKLLALLCLAGVLLLPALCSAGAAEATAAALPLPAKPQALEALPPELPPENGEPADSEGGELAALSAAVADYQPPGRRPTRFGCLFEAADDFDLKQWQLIQAAGGNGLALQTNSLARLPDVVRYPALKHLLFRQPEELADRLLVAEQGGDGGLQAELAELRSGLSARGVAEQPLTFEFALPAGTTPQPGPAIRLVELLEETFGNGSRGSNATLLWAGRAGAQLVWLELASLARQRAVTACGSLLAPCTPDGTNLGGAHYYSWIGAMARSLAKYHHATLGPARLPCRSTAADDDTIELAAYTLAAHGYTALLFELDHQSAALADYQQIKRAAYALGAVEAQLVGAEPVASRIALGWSETSSVWEQIQATATGSVGESTYARQHLQLYLLLRHLQLPVELLSDADLAEGRLVDYDLFFAAGRHTTLQAAAAIREWVAAGGTLIAGSGGGGWRDEYNRPLSTLFEVYGISGLKPAQATEVVCAGERLSVSGERQRIVTAQATVVATFDDGGAAIVTNSFGQGRAMLLGFQPAQLRHYRDNTGAVAALPAVADSAESDAPRELHLMQLLKGFWPELRLPVVTTQPLLEANLLVDRAGKRHITLVNYGSAPLAAVTLRVSRLAAGQPKWAVAQFATAVVTHEEQDLVITLPINRFELITLQD